MPYSATIVFRPAGDQRPAERCPVQVIPPVDTAAERTVAVEHACHNLQHQPVPPHYEVLGVEYHDLCDRCGGTGTIKLKPKGWRKRTAPPWFMLTTKPCPDCAAKEVPNA